MLLSASLQHHPAGLLSWCKRIKPEKWLVWLQATSPAPFPSCTSHSKPGKTPSIARQMAIHLCASHGAVAELMALCHSHVRRLLPLRLTPRLRISSGFATSSHHTEQWAHWVMSRICQSGMLQLPWQSFYRRKQYHAAVVIAISLCLF